MLFWDLEDTIVAVASGNESSARGIVRLSGPKAVAIATELSRRTLENGEQSKADLSVGLRTFPSTVGRSLSVVESEIWLGEALGWDEGWIYVWPTKRSYTGQPSVEFHLVGCLPVLEALLEQCRLRGARNAQPGEFTLRSFLSGRMDLTQAEAVLGVINARGEEELTVALSQLAGGLSKPIRDLRQSLIEVLAHLEAGLDFVEEDIEFISQEELLGSLTRTLEQVQGLLSQIQSRSVFSGVPKIVLVGRPNTGKSSLLNALSTSFAAIVSDVSGTTRDYLIASTQLGMGKVELIDTAGLDLSMQSDMDQESQRQSWRQVHEANVVLFVTDGTEDSEQEWAFFESLHEYNLAARWIVVINKSDCYCHEVVMSKWKEHADARLGKADLTPIVKVSAVTGEGLAMLRRVMESEVQKLRFDGGMSMLPATASRCRESLTRCGQSLQAAIKITQQLPMQEELVAAEIRLAMEELGWIAGEVYTDDLLDRIFSQFCIGK